MRSGDTSFHKFSLDNHENIVSFFLTLLLHCVAGDDEFDN